MERTINKGGGGIERRDPVAFRLVDGGSGGKQQLYALRLTKVTSDPQAMAKIGVLCVLQQARDFAVVALLDRVKYRAFHVGELSLGVSAALVASRPRLSALLL